MSKEMGEMGRSRQVGQAGVSAPLEGARRATGLGAEGASAGAAPLASGQRWSAGGTWCCGCCGGTPTCSVRGTHTRGHGG